MGKLEAPGELLTGAPEDPAKDSDGETPGRPLEALGPLGDAPGPLEDAPGLLGDAPGEERLGVALSGTTTMTSV